MAKLTKKDVILYAAKKLPREFTEEDLAVAAFTQEPTMFALAGFPKLVNNNTVKLCLMGADGLVRKGKLVRVKTGVYKLPES